MKMSELILAVGDDHVRFQNLLNDAHTIDKTKYGTKITFYTDGVEVEELLGGDSSKTKNVGLVVWLPRDRVNAAIAAEREAAGGPTGQAPASDAATRSNAERRDDL